MKKGGIYTGYVESVDFPNKGNVVVRTEEDGQVIEEKAVVKNSILGQTVKFMVNKKKHGKCEGRLLEVVCQADTETNERCEHFGKCGGCVYQTVRYEEQLKMKEAAVKKKAMEQCQKRYILSDASKFNVISTIKFADLKKAEIITDHLENKEFKRITNIEEVFS